MIPKEQMKTLARESHGVQICSWAWKLTAAFIEAMGEDKRYGFPTLKIAQGSHSLIVRLQIEHLKLP